MPRSNRGHRDRKPQPYDFSQFRGYRGPRFTPVPDEFLDHQLADLTSAEAKVMLFLFRKTYGYRKSGDHVSFAQLQSGTVAADGTIIDRGTGLSKATVWRALKGLQKKRLIEVYRQTTRAGDPDVNYYRIREYSEPDGPAGDSPGTSGPPGSGRPSSRPRLGSPPKSANRGARSSEVGLSSSETTPASELNHGNSGTKPPGGLKAKPTREDYARENYTPSPELEAIAREFLGGIGYSRPSRPKRERAIRILSILQKDDGYSLDELQTACGIAIALGARGPELIPHVIGQEPSPEDVVGERVVEQERADRDHWQELTDRFARLPEEGQQSLLLQARQSNRILSKRPPTHPLVRAAAIALLGEL